LRNCTGTVESIPLIAASIMSKKLAERLHGLVLDVTRGSGAFLPGLEQGIELAQTMARLGEGHDCRVVALITAMDRPLGWACGSALETEEAIHALRGEGPADLMEVTYALGAEMLVMAGVADTAAAARPLMAEAIASGRAARCFQDIIEAQGGNPGVVDDPAALPQAAVSEVYRAARTGLVAQVEPRAIGRAVCALGGGRSRVADRIDPGVGFVIGVKPGDRVDAGQAVATVYARDAAGVEEGRAVLERAIVIADEASLGLPLVSHRVTVDGVLEFPLSY
jgi:thymidine phosphorylase